MLHLLFLLKKCNVVSCSVSLSVGEILIVCTYRSPSSSAVSDIELSTFLHHLCSMDHKYKLVMGDFNMPNVNWEPNSVSFQSNHVTECFDDNFLTNVVKMPTRGN